MGFVIGNWTVKITASSSQTVKVESQLCMRFSENNRCKWQGNRKMYQQGSPVNSWLLYFSSFSVVLEHECYWSVMIWNSSTMNFLMLHGSDYKNTRKERKCRLLNSGGSMVWIRNEGENTWLKKKVQKGGAGKQTNTWKKATISVVSMSYTAKNARWWSAIRETYKCKNKKILSFFFINNVKKN